MIDEAIEVEFESPDVSQRSDDVFVGVFVGDGPVVGWCFWCAQELVEAVFVEDGDVAAGIFEVIDLVLFAAAGAFRPEDEVVDVV